jgi:hypothetical protein
MAHPKNRPGSDHRDRRGGSRRSAATSSSWLLAVAQTNPFAPRNAMSRGPDRRHEPARSRNRGSGTGLRDASLSLETAICSVTNFWLNFASQLQALPKSDFPKRPLKMDLDALLKDFAIVQAQSVWIKAMISFVIVSLGVGSLFMIWQRPNPKGAEDVSPAGAGTLSVNSHGQSGGQTAGVIYNNYLGAEKAKNAEILNIFLEKVTVFYIAQESDFYQIGVVLRFFNKDASPHLLTDVVIDPVLFQWGGEGGAWMQKIFITGISATNNDDFAIRSGEYRDVKIMLPIKFALKLMGSIPPEIIFLSPFSLQFKDIEKLVSGVRPISYGNAGAPISLSEWGNLLKSNGGLETRNITYKRTPLEFDSSGRSIDYILYNPDASAKIEIYGFDRTDYRKNKDGVLVMLKGRGRPVIDSGWMLLANTYDQLMHNADALSLYKSIIPLDEHGALKRLDAGFVGADRFTFGPLQKEMLPWTCDFTHNPPACSYASLAH